MRIIKRSDPRGMLKDILPTQMVCTACRSFLEIEIDDIHLIQRKTCDFRGDPYTQTKPAFLCPVCRNDNVVFEHNKAHQAEVLAALRVRDLLAIKQGEK